MTERLSPLELMTRLISFPTVSRDSNLPLVDWVEDYLAGHGITAHRFYNEEQGKAAIFAHVGPETEGGVVLSGHTDVVPVDGQPWASDPWTVTERDGKYFGRGTCDMKGFDALALWALVEARYRDIDRPLQIALSFDEEVGCTGAPPMIERILQTLPRASAVIVGEPSMMEAVTGHKGGQGFMVDVWGHEVHSSIAYRGVSAIMEAAKIIDWANQVNAEEAAKTPSEMAAVFDPPYTSVHVGTIEGGTAANITAKHCRFDLGFRAVPTDDQAAWRKRMMDKIAEVEAGMKAVHPDARIDVAARFDVPGLKPEDQGEAEALVRAITGDNATHVVSYGTEAGQFQHRGYSSVVCGPGNIAQAHQPDEFITVEQFNQGHGFMERLLERL
ncbi:acetylornithine deacetylase [Lutimaribacter sp. EGI FJ00015]|uniref:Acetylornithine deacetylase n=1 Tax=Lutimaribacter degradans TaxID=2945989 RepID=A0ACC5ZTW2_9RHOB|nr:acetylornithine deacetylase [Lutimaribacter sp. EGI FJ00013]MCM2560834.1 acetylornithine deacetylase [Lutimaribacter sp. EGI FJ00013]MCO0612221.1 acetylornithine deacetylase [Lutimaribacter sp. EGI FJ00015]MCO0634659.1 acetylornithine deacetylase [Lutimaribacter sp. EGI FJ00014]